MKRVPAARPAAAQVLGAERVARLAAGFERIAATRMAGLPVVHPQLRVEPVGFALHQGQPDGEPGMLGVLVTPWSMNLIWLGLDADVVSPAPAERIRDIGGEQFAFRLAHEDGIGPYESCSLASPMFAFADQTAAVATAQAVLDLLRRPEDQPVPARRRFLFGAGAPASTPSP